MQSEFLLVSSNPPLLAEALRLWYDGWCRDWRRVSQPGVFMLPSCLSAPFHVTRNQTATTNGHSSIKQKGGPFTVFEMIFRDDLQSQTVMRNYVHGIPQVDI
ncbi:hypothetical protein Bbelb_019880 [Branchiostoma belcheri]|nr:hypothetical protein Bbelb_019880 [Branchiostoma belcheri]